MTPRTVSTSEASDITGASLRQLNYWRMNGFVNAAIPARGSGSCVGWSRANCIRLAKLRLLSEALGNEHVSIAHLGQLVAGQIICRSPLGNVRISADFGTLEASISVRFERVSDGKAVSV